jgi:hypothetical protein
MKVIIKNQFIFYCVNNKMSDISFPYYVGSSLPSDKLDYLQLGPELYIKPSGQENGVTVLYAKLLSLNDPNYIRLDATSQYGVNKKFVMEISTANFDTNYVDKYLDSFKTFRYPSGRLLRPFTDTNKQSSVLYFDRTGLNNDVNIEDEILRLPGSGKYLNLTLNNPSKLYLLLPSKSVQFCCRNNALGDECGVGSKALNNRNDICKELASSICNRSSPNDFFGQFCQRDYCKTDPKSVNTGICDEEYKTLCNVKQDLSVSPEQYPWYNKYPDYCSCFMNREFLAPICDSYVNFLGIKRNKNAQNALGLNTDDINQCNKACKVHPLCKLGAQVPYNLNRGDNPVIKGSVFPLECQNIDLCVQDVTVNQTGNNIGSLSVSQNANCKTVLKKICTNSTYSPCTGSSVSGNKYTYKKYLLEDKDNGACADPGTAFVCAEFQVDPTSIRDARCDTDKEKINVNIQNTYTNGFEPEVLQAGKDLVENLKILDKFKSPSSKISSFTGSKLSFNPINNLLNVSLDCVNCVVGYTGAACKLSTSTKKWTQIKTLEEILKPSKNGGNTCQFDKTKIVVDCPYDNDCVVNLKNTDIACVNGSFNYNFDIVSFNSGNGKACSDAILELLPSTIVNPTITIDENLKKGKATVSCNDCVVDYVADENTPDGRCHLKGGRYVITKYGKVIKREEFGGKCPPSEMAKLTSSIDVPCTFNQDCKFIENPISDNCDDTEGIRTIKFSRDTLETGIGRKCSSVGNSLSNRYSNVIDSYYDEDEKTQVIKTGCEIKTNCLVSFKDTKCKDGVKTDTYNIIIENSSRGKTCEETVRDIVNDTNISIERDGNTILAKGSCDKPENQIVKFDSKKYMAVSVIAFILIILFAIFLL